MDVKQIDFSNKNSIKQLITFVHNIEQKLSSLKTIHEKLFDFISIVSKTHENILQELNIIKFILNQEKDFNQDEIIEIDENKTEWDEDDEQNQSINSIQKFDSKSVTNLNSTDQQINSPLTHPTDRLSSCSPSSYASSSTNSINNNNNNRINSSTSKRSSNLKKSDQLSTRVKSPKSVTFNIDQKQQSSISIEDKKPLNETTIINNSNELIRDNSDLIPQLFKQHHQQVTNQQNIGYKLGNALTNVRIHEIESKNGDYLRLLNISNTDDYDLSGHFIQQNIACVPISRFRFPFNTIIRAGQTITIWCGSLRDIEAQPPHIFIWKEQRRWETGPECVTILAKPTGQAIAWARSSNRVNTDQSSSDILFVHSKGSIITSDVTSVTPNSFKSRSRLSAFNFIGNNKPPFAHSPSSPIHPDYNGNNLNTQNDLRSQINAKGSLSQLLNRPKSSPFSSHNGCKQDLISMNYLRTQQNQTNKQTTVKT